MRESQGRAVGPGSPGVVCCAASTDSPEGQGKGAELFRRRHGTSQTPGSQGRGAHGVLTQAWTLVGGGMGTRNPPSGSGGRQEVLTQARTLAGGENGVLPDTGIGIP